MSRSLRIAIPAGFTSEIVDGRLYATYFPLTTGEALTAALMTARTGDFPRRSVMDGDLNNALAVKIDSLVKLHLEEFRASLFEAIKGETSQCEFHVLRPTLELCLQLPDGDACEFVSHQGGSFSEKEAK
jgi:hypothetical protein